MPAYEAVESRLARKIDTSGDCWIWTAAVDPGGYGRVWHDGNMRLAHRVTYEVFVGPIPDGLSLDHICHNADTSCDGGKGCPHRLCVNPAHLEPVTQGDNARRGRTGQRSGEQKRSRTHCIHGHEFTPENTYVIASKNARVCITCRRANGARHDAKRRG